MGRHRSFPPTPRVHQGKVRVWWNGRYWHLGRADEADWKAEYVRVCDVWLTDPNAVPHAPDDYLLSELCRDYIVSDAVPAHRKPQVRWVVKLLLASHADQTVAEFGPRALGAWQSALGRMTAPDGTPRYSRSTIVRWVAIIRRIWRWGVATERIEETVYRALLSVDGPKRSEGRAPKRVQPANPAHVKKCLPHLRGPVRAMVELQLLTGMRPSELFRLTPGQVHRSGTVDVPDVGEVRLDGLWVYLPETHKTQHHGKAKWVLLGPKSQAVLGPFLDRAADAPCFDPRESVEERNQLSRSRRRGPVQKRKPGPGSRARSRYTRQAYLNAVIRACDRAGVPRFGVYQLRHAAGVAVDSAYGLDHAQAVLGHDSPQVTRRYAKRSFSRAAEVARATG